MMTSFLKSRLSLITPQLIRRKPKFLARMSMRSIESAFGRPPSLLSVLFHAHYQCNLNCRHCYEKRFTQTFRPLLTLAEQCQVIEDCMRLGALSVDFVSGESTLYPDLPKLVEACHPYQTYITLATNGYGLDQTRINELFEMGVDKLNVSLESYYAEEHDQLRRKKGAHRRALRTIRLSKSVGMDVQATVFVSKNDTRRDGFEKLVNFALDHKIRLTFKAAIPLGQLEGNHDRLISDYDRITLFRLHKKHGNLIRTCIATHRSTCPAFNRLITITAYGDVLPCNAIHASFGNVKEMPLSDILKKGRVLPWFDGSCSGCPPADDIRFVNRYLAKIYGSHPYPATAENVFGDVWRKDI